MLSYPRRTLFQVCIKTTATLLTSLWLMDTSSGYIANSPIYNSLSGPFEPSPTLTRHHQLYAKVKAAGQSDQQVNNYLDVSSSHHPSNPSFITVDAAVSPLSIIFRSSSSFLRVQQLHHGAPGHLQETSSTDEPIIHRHMIVKPILLQIHEIISPSRRIIQKILPVTVNGVQLQNSCPYITNFSDFIGKNRDHIFSWTCHR